MQDIIIYELVATVLLRCTFVIINIFSACIVQILIFCNAINIKTLKCTVYITVLIPVTVLSIVHNILFAAISISY